ncbi:secondary thiamine-phosphate synthase enzyme YjbQ [Lyngbya sp. CCY1209]|uniref:secondary thiamine-phosphate synthase enzyme YjbQ n=1 Tax=Lyngbya sp. CCY1209 TaxID=2886103 RepID=UPI002D7786FC|nr:secondary thiamine-phosphate synthase enzyme YjbQ [Lyngbya sp. CCY1209]
MESTSIQNGQVLVFSQHRTTALTINENEERLWEDIRVYLKKLAPPENRYLHNDLHHPDVPPDEPINAHSHLMAITLSTSEVIPVVEGRLGWGRWPSLLLLELDGPRSRRVLVQVSGESIGDPQIGTCGNLAGSPVERGERVRAGHFSHNS